MDARAAGLVGGIESENRASCLLHEALGFERCGVVKAAGYKFDRWLDLALYQRVLPAQEDLT